jgi:predicted O-methyltransferase YrrM
MGPEATETSATPVWDELRRAPPLAHGGGTAYFGLEWTALRWLERSVTAEMTTLETGCGASTIVFAAAGARHLAISPDDGEHGRVLQYCAEHGVATDRLRFIAEPSDAALMGSWQRQPLDLVLIDGAHGFPFPALDWYLTATHLRVGGLVVLDDAYLPSVHVVVRFLRASSSWRQEAPIGYRTVAFRKLSEELSYDWVGSAFDQRPHFDYLPLCDRPLAYVRTLVLDRHPAITTVVRRLVGGGRR